MLWFQLLKRGIHGNIVQVIESMYKNIMACVRTPDGHTDWFSCMVGTRQGCMLSPFLFALYLNAFVEMIQSYQCQGIYVSESFPNVCTLLYADDMVLCADTIGNLQKQLNVLEIYCQKWGMKVNMKKSMIVVYRNGGILKKNEKWHFKGQLIQCVNQYKYLGMMFCSTLNWNIALQTLRTQSNKALFNLYQMNNMCSGLPSSVLFEVFDKAVKPILCYGAEIWGHTKMCCAENVHISLCKRILGVGSKASNVAVLSECGRYPLFISCATKCIKYWLKINMMSSNRLMKQCYIMSYNLDAAGRNTWATNIKDLLYRYGFGYVWWNQSVGDINLFISEFSSRLRDNYRQEWHLEMSTNGKLSLYQQIKTTYENYLSELRHKKYIAVLARFRISNHSLAVETGRYEGLPRNQRICKICEKVHKNYCIEDELHFVTICPAYHHLRVEHLNCIVTYRGPVENIFLKIMMSKDPSVIKSFGLYLLKAIKHRQLILKDL